MPTLLSDFLPVLLKRKDYNDLSDYNKGWTDGVEYLAVFGGMVAIFLRGPGWGRRVNETSFNLARLANSSILPEKRMTLGWIMLYVWDETGRFCYRLGGDGTLLDGSTLLSPCENSRDKLLTVI